MLTLVMLGAVVLMMYRIAEMEGQSGIIWGSYTFFVCFACAALIPIPFLNIGAGAIAAYLSMFVYKVVKNE